jgi:hypothetical protein
VAVSAALRDGWRATAVLGAAAVLTTVALPSGLAAAKGVSATQLLKAACQATLSAKAFQVQGSVTEGGSPLQVDVYFGSAGSLMQVTENGDRTINLITNGSSLYIKGNQAFWQAAGGSGSSSSVTSALTDRWLDVSADTKDFGGLAKQLTKHSFLTQCTSGSTSYAGHGTVDGIPVTTLHQSGGGGPLTISVESGPTPYLIKIYKGGSTKNSGQLVFSDFNVQPDTSEPAGTVPLSSAT